jgi:small subunit ribosomal protein S8
MLTDPISDMLTRIRNANRALHETVEMPASRVKEEIARLLKEEGYIKDYRVVAGRTKTPAVSYDLLLIELKFGRNRERVLTDLKRSRLAGCKSTGRSAS